VITNMLAIALDAQAHEHNPGAHALKTFSSRAAHDAA
jgi:hypothetical protein